ncbi:hypothetical protein [Psychrobacter sp. BF1]|uniref:hypothetical protein n=1 Tax=Psychrobacter sp. BF1 TaxID=2821147 RepID=UPI001C4DF446|nr:hypothetical protein [Psychrobacter sp. BF1]
MKIVVLIAALLILTGCMSLKNTKDLPAELLYQPPVLGQTATIMGSSEPGYMSLVGDRIAYIMEINGKRVPKERKEDYSATWDTIYPIATGEHTMTISYRIGGHYAVPSKIIFDAEANRNYQLNFVTDIGTEWFSKNSYVDFWVMDKATQQPVSDVMRSQLPAAPRVISYPIIINN